MQQTMTENLEKAQRTRRFRWYMALISYVIVFIAVSIINQIGLGAMPEKVYALFVLIAVAGNLVFGYLFFSHRNLKFKDPSLTLIQMNFSYIWGVVPLYYLPEARLAVMLFFIPSFSFGILQLNRRDYYKAMSLISFLLLGVILLEYYQKRPGFVLSVELFKYSLFLLILGWFAFFGSFISNIRHRVRVQHQDLQAAHERLRREVEERRQIQVEKEKLIVDLQKAITDVKTLSGMLPICATCKKIRDDKGYWNQIETYIHDHSNAELSHSICPDCARELYPDFKIYDE